nr:hypothetical protein CFP56_67849 [Quercus suber]
MASSDQDTLKKIEEMMTRMTANIIGRFHYLKGAQEKKKKSDAKPQKKFGEGNSSNSGNNGGKTSEVKVINVRRELTPLGITLSQALETLSTKGFIKLLDLGSYTSNTSAPNYNASEYCKYHQNHGHSIDKCTRLCHDIEDLIQSGKILKPPINLPNIKTNHLPNYNVVPPPT